MIKLETLQIASPCSADWNAMVGSSQVRFCGGCRKNVYNLSEMTHDEAETLVNQLEGKLCVRFYTRPDGTALTSDCPVGLRAVRYRQIRKLSYAAAVALSCAGSLLHGSGPAQGATIKKAVVKHEPIHPIPQHTMGKLTMPKIIIPKTVTPKAAVPNPAPPLKPYQLAPDTRRAITMGFVAQQPLMGAPLAPKPEPPAKKK